MYFGSSKHLLIKTVLLSVINVLKFLKIFSLFSNKMLVTRPRIHKMLVKIANREDPDQFRSSLIYVCTVCIGLFGKQLVFLEHLL